MPQLFILNEGKQGSVLKAAKPKHALVILRLNNHIPHLQHPTFHGMKISHLTYQSNGLLVLCGSTAVRHAALTFKVLVLAFGIATLTVPGFQAKIGGHLCSVWDGLHHSRAVLRVQAKEDPDLLELAKSVVTSSLHRCT